MLSIITFLGQYFGGFYKEVVQVFPVFPLALLGSLFTRWLIEKMQLTHLISELIQREIGILATDLLITTAMASLNIELLRADWVPITVLSITGLIWNLIGMLLFSKYILKDEWFERSIIEFGNATGVAASGLLLLRLADPKNNTDTLPIFSVKQLFLQPLLSGGLITVIAPIAVIQLGLEKWTLITGTLTSLFLLTAILVNLRFNSNTS